MLAQAMAAEEGCVRKMQVFRFLKILSSILRIYVILFFPYEGLDIKKQEKLIIKSSCD